MTETLPARRPTGAVLAPSGTLEIEGLNPRDLGLRHPLLRIRHPAGGYKLGQMEAAQLEVVFLKAHRYREYREGENWNDPVLCASSDGYLPLATIAQPRAKRCESCPYGIWSDDPNTGNRVAPPCDEGLALLGVWPGGQNLPFWFLLNSWSRIKPTREFLQTILYYNAAAVGRGEEPIKGFYEFWVTLTTEDRRNGGIHWAVPQYASRRMPAEEAAPYRDFYAVARDLVYVPEVRGAEAADDIAEEARAATEAEVVTEPAGGNSSVPF